VDETPMTELVNLSKYDGDDVVKIDRSTRFGNPYRLKKDGGDYTRHESVERYREWFYNRIENDPDFKQAVEDLEGETLACWCTPKACHGDVIVAYLEKDS
jgi:hypothetical protein